MEIIVIVRTCLRLYFLLSPQVLSNAVEIVPENNHFPNTGKGTNEHDSLKEWRTVRQAGLYKHNPKFGLKF